ncbi:hypothetical protein [Agromyces kandeliae]|uniref:Integral membrane protein n=1 Tax=Agromyces kandeliae TaxID=2666141 RepID=A0A6L5R3I4_9MICO|nr:hypothetical protein [Agromyces kandeliae]MRX44435.1 hypothetical protein [Agromyces kandeliae]
MTSRGARTARGAAVAAFAVLAASLAHTVGGGTPPGPVALALAFAFSVPVAMLVVGGRMPLLRASVAALVAQAALHLLYAVGTPGSDALGAAAVDAHALHAGGTIPLDAFVAVDHGHAAMPVAHVAAAALTVAFLAVLGRSVAAVAAVAGALARGIRLLVTVLTGAAAPAPRDVARPVSRRDGPSALGILLLSSLRHRGPPEVLAAA